LYFVLSRSDAWQRLHTSSEIVRDELALSASILCSEWQSVHVGASRTPAASALP